MAPNVDKTRDARPQGACPAGPSDRLLYYVIRRVRGATAPRQRESAVMRSLAVFDEASRLPSRCRLTRDTEQCKGSPVRPAEL